MKYLSLLVFASGAAILGVELSAARLLEPWFGNSQIVWAALIGLVLLYLALGGWLGGQLSDRYPHLEPLLTLIAISGLGVGAIPLISPPILEAAAIGLSNFAVGLLLGTLAAILLIFSLPLVLLGAVTPWAIRIALTHRGDAGRVTGRLYAWATLGSLVGTFLPVLWLIPSYGTRWSFYFFALGLLGISLLGFLLKGQRMVGGLVATALLILIVSAQMTSGASVQSRTSTAGELIYEDESLYGYIAVRQWGNERHLKLNDGIGIHSVYHPDTLLSLGIWDYFLLAPFFRPTEQPSGDDRVLVIGLAAGTVPSLYQRIYGPLEVVGVELDPQIIEVGRRYFGMGDSETVAVAADGRRWLQQQPSGARFDFILIDAYRPPYIPFHLATIEFFELANSHLAPNGVVAINVGRTDTNFALVEALVATLRAVFPSVFIIDEPGPENTLANSLVVASAQPVEVVEVKAAAADTVAYPVEFRQFVSDALKYLRVPAVDPTYLPMTDDRAPIERIVHELILDFLLRSVPADSLAPASDS